MICKLKYHIPYVTHLQAKEIKATCNPQCETQKRKRQKCKVEFIQPSNWLYSVPNLLVIQHLVTLYLGGFDVRVVSEIE